MKVLLKRMAKECFFAYRRKKVVGFLEKEENDYLSKFPSPFLTSAEKKEMEDFWKKFIPYKVSDSYYRITKGIDRFDIGYIPHNIFFPYILRSLNPINESFAFSNKGIYGFYFHDIHRAKDIVRNINGCFYNETGQICSENDAVRDILSYEEALIVKPSIDSSCGKNIKMLSDYSEENIRDTFKIYSRNFVFQELVEQSDQTARFNPTSLNTFRVTTLFLNGIFSVLYSVFRCGGINSIVDNAGAGGIMVGVHPNGTFYDYGFNKYGKKCYSSYTGVKFSNCVINCFDDILELAHYLHLKLPFCGLVGWDIALDVNNSPLLIEVNLKCPEIFIGQMCTGPIFGDRLTEVLDYVFSSSKNKYDIND